MHHSSVTIDSPIGCIRLTEDGEGICGIEFVKSPAPRGKRAPSPRLRACAKALAEYFDGKRRSFDDFPVVPRGSAFSRSVLQALRSVPFGTTMTYGELARKIGKEKAARAVGGALSGNPLAILLPCHRIVPARRSCRAGIGCMGGFAWGKKRKEWLLSHEGRKP